MVQDKSVIMSALHPCFNSPVVSHWSDDKGQMRKLPPRPFAVQPLLDLPASSYTTVPSSLGHVCVTPGPLHELLLLSRYLFLSLCIKQESVLCVVNCLSAKGGNCPILSPSTHPPIRHTFHRTGVICGLRHVTGPLNSRVLVYKIKIRDCYED